METVTIGTDITVGSDVFSLLSSVLAALPYLIFATGVVAIIIVCVRCAANPTADNFENTKAQLVRIVVVSVFLAMLGSIISWLFSGMGATSTWLSTITSF